MSEIEFFEDISNLQGKLKKTKFKKGFIFSPFYFLLKIKELEDSGSVRVCFYKKNSQKVTEKKFPFGTDGQYYEYVLFFDQIKDLGPGKYRYAIFLNYRLIFEDHLLVSSRSTIIADK